MRALISGHFVSTSRELGWDTLKNGDLIAAAEANGFEAMLTGDKNITYQQNLSGRTIALIVLHTTDWGTLKLNPAPIVAALKRVHQGALKWSNHSESVIWKALVPPSDKAENEGIDPTSYTILDMVPSQT